MREVEMDGPKWWNGDGDGQTNEVEIGNRCEGRWFRLFGKVAHLIKIGLDWELNVPAHGSDRERLIFVPGGAKLFIQGGAPENWLLVEVKNGL